MSHMKILGLLAVAAVSLMAWAATASATFTSPTGTTLGQGAEIHMANEGYVVIDPAKLPEIECESTIDGSLTVSGGTVVNITTLTFAPCTNDWHVTTLTAGELEFVSDGIGGTYNGTVYSQGMTIEATRYGVNCRYATIQTTKLGSFTGGNPGTLHVATALPFHSGSFLCGDAPASTEGDYVTTASLYLHG